VHNEADSNNIQEAYKRRSVMEEHIVFLCTFESVN